MLERLGEDLVMNGASCLCLTYGRPHLLEEALHSFLIQDYAGPKELIVVNDHPDQTLVFEHPDVTVVNLPRRLRTLGEKRNLSVALAKYDHLLVWDDDDIYLPWRITETMKTLPTDHFYKCPNAWVMNDGRITELGYNLFHSGSAFDRWLFERVGGYTLMNGGEDADIELRFQHVTENPGEFWKHTILPRDRVYYIYRWSHGSYHTTGVTDVASIVPTVASTGRVELRPTWRHPYDRLAAAQLHAGVEPQPGIRGITFVCFSKDRPLQLDGYIRSFARHIGQGSLTVLYHATSEAFAEAYGALAATYPWVRFQRQTDFSGDLQGILRAVPSRFVCFGVDDAVFIRPVDAGVVMAAMDDPDVFAFSLRLGRNITRSMFSGAMTLPDVALSPRGTLSWDVHASHHCGDWGYSWELCGTVYRTALARYIVEKVSPSTPNTLEAAGGGLWSSQTTARLMHCFPESALVVPTVNVVQSDFPNGFLGTGISTETLLELWQAGDRIDLDACERIVTDQIHVADLPLQGRPAGSVAGGGRAESMTSGNESYLDVCRTAARDPASFAGFRRNPAYQVVLEHVWEDLGRQYLSLLSPGGRARAALAEIAQHDHVGNPVTMMVDSGITLSPSTLRYLKVADDIEKLFGTLDGADVIEVGVGYGGQCRVLDALYNIKSYTLVDLREPLDLAQRFLGHVPLRCSVRFASMDELVEQACDLFVSNFAFSEFSRPLQEAYFTKVINRAARGYVTCNDIAPAWYQSMTAEELCRRMRGRRRPEEPLTHPRNQLVFWGAID